MYSVFLVLSIDKAPLLCTFYLKWYPIIFFKETSNSYHKDTLLGRAYNEKKPNVISQQMYAPGVNETYREMCCILQSTEPLCCVRLLLTLKSHLKNKESSGSRKKLECGNQHS